MNKANRKDPEFLKWARRQGGSCCVCRAVSGDQIPASELHHFGKSGMGLKGVDHFVARVCRDHHTFVQGKYRSWFVRNNELETWTAMLEDALSMLSNYEMEHKDTGSGGATDVF